jgi:hypothetical protein
MRSHNKRTRSPLHPFEGQTSLLTRTLEVLRQTALQVHQLAVCKQLAGLLPHACPQLDAFFHSFPKQNLIVLPRHKRVDDKLLRKKFIYVIDEILRREERDFCI